jgi:hypothetical protein
VKLTKIIDFEVSDSNIWHVGVAPAIGQVARKLGLAASRRLCGWFSVLVI